MPARLCKLILLIMVVISPLPSWGIGPDEPPTILLRNVSIPAQSESGEPRLVNILIKDGNLDIISPDPISRDKAHLTYDTRGGSVLGQLEPGKKANFIIFTENPTHNFEVLLDTKSYASFAMFDGKILKNSYDNVIRDTPAEKKKQSQGWLAYTAPPLAVPLNYQDKNRWNRFSGKYVSGLLTGALLVDRQYWTEQDDNSKYQVGDLDLYDGGEIRGLRFGAIGTLNFKKPWVWTLFGATHAFDKGFDATESDEMNLYDVRLDIPLWESASFSVGKQKEPISMERQMGMIYLPMQERAAVSDALLPSRNIGIVAASTLFNNRATIAGGAFNNWLDRHQPNSFSENSTQYIGRATWLPLISENESSLIHLGVGLRRSNSKEGFITGTEPEFNNAPDYVFTGLLNPENSMTYQAEASVRSGPFWLHGEYVRTDLDSVTDDDPSFDGFHVTASWIVSGEVRPYSRQQGAFSPVPISKSVNQDGWGAWELSTRYSNLNLTDGEVNGGEVDIWSAGINWWLSPYLSFNINYRYITLDRLGVKGNSQGVNSRITMMLE